MKKLVIIGAGGHGRVIADVAKAGGQYESIVFLDDALPKLNGEFKVVGRLEDFSKYITDCEFIVAIGNNASRKRIQSDIESNGAKLATLIHPAAVIGSNVSIGRGSVIMPGAIVNTGTNIGEGVIINTAASVDHDCEIGSFAHISVGSHLAGTVTVGNENFVGAGAIISNNIEMCAGCMIGAGAVVVKNIEEAGTYIGVPAKQKE